MIECWLQTIMQHKRVNVFVCFGTANNFKTSVKGTVATQYSWLILSRFEFQSLSVFTFSEICTLSPSKHCLTLLHVLIGAQCKPILLEDVTFLLCFCSIPLIFRWQLFLNLFNLITVILCKRDNIFYAWGSM